MMMRKSLTLVGTAFLAIAAIGMTGCNQGTNKNANVPANSAANTPLAACDAKTDASIEAALMLALESNPRIAPQMKQINFFSTACVVTLQGWVNDQDDFKAVLKATLATPDVKSMNFDAFWIGSTNVPQPPPGGQCNAGYKECGDFCIPEGDKCIIKGIIPGGTPVR